MQAGVLLSGHCWEVSAGGNSQLAKLQLLKVTMLLGAALYVEA